MPLRADPVPMPEKKITFKTINNTIYAYYTLRAYRNENGKPTSDEVAIGKKDPASGMLIPNRKYFELFQDTEIPSGEKCTTQTPIPARAASYGNAYSLMEVAKSIGLHEVLEKCFPTKWQNILVAAIYILCEGNVMMYIDDWFDETDTPFVDRMDDQQCSRIFSSISYSERADFFKEWGKLRTEREYIAYDITSISTYSKEIDIAEWGYNRDNEKLAQVNLGMFYGSESHLPVYYDMYNGSIPDKSRLAFMMAGAEKLGITNVRFVMDRGFVTEDNLRYMAGAGYLFVTALPAHWIEAKKIIDNCKNIIRKSVNRINEFGMYALSIDIDSYGHNMKAHVYYDLDKQSMDEKELYASIERLRTNLEKLNKNGGLTKKHSDFFNIERESNGKFNFVLDNEKIDVQLSHAGFFILLSNDNNLSSGDVLKIYRSKDVIEKNFDQLKNGLDFRRLRTHVNETTDGKVFVGFIALIMRSYLLCKIKDNVATRHLTFDKVLIEFRKIKVITFDDSSQMLLPLTKLQRSIFDAIGISHEKLVGSFA